jgi:hypothetical protein
MAKVEIFDKPMCCSTGICGPEVDPILPRFAADLDWLKTQGHEVERSNLAQQPAVFAGNSVVCDVLAAEGVDSLPLILVNGKIVSRADYPSRDQLAALANEKMPVGATAKPGPLPVAGQAGDCCGDTGCC